MQGDAAVLRERARVAAARGDLDAAIGSLLLAATQTQLTESEYAAILRPLEEALAKRGNIRGALSVAWYLASSDKSAWARASALLGATPPVDRARTLAAIGQMEKAAREMESAGLPAAAAIYCEKAEDWQGARALWSRLAQVSGGAANAYNVALVHFNLARSAKHCGDASQARAAIVSAVRMLEEAADHFESIGQRERAFDCFQVLVQVGRESGMFEDVLEGFVNCIRILREDHLKYFALQYLNDAVEAARTRGELSAAATLAREAADYARTLGQHAVSAHYTIVQAGLWRDVAQQHLSRGAPPEIAENALLASVLAFADVGKYTRVGELCAELATMDLEPSRREHYARAATRYAAVKDEATEATPLPAHMRLDSSFPDVWHVDILEWEQRGSASEACAEVLLDKRWPDLIRRKALLARLTALVVEARPDDAGAEATSLRTRLAEQLAQLQLYAVLAPLEKLFERPERAVRAAVLTALSTLYFKRSFITVRAGLRDADAAIVDQAAKAVESLYFPHAFDPLARILRESTQANVRTAALRALSRIDTTEAAELLMGVVEHGAPADRAAAVEALRRARGAKFVELARAALPESAGHVQASLREVLRARGIAA